MIIMNWLYDLVMNSNGIKNMKNDEGEYHKQCRKSESIKIMKNIS